MRDNYWDDVANEAVDKLAEELAPSLRSAISDATGDALRRLDEEVSRQSEQIDAATRRVRQAVLDMVDEINLRTATALMDGLASDVLPVLREEGQKARRSGEEHFQVVLRGGQELISSANGFASRAEERLMAAARSNRDELTASIEQSLHPVLTALGERMEQIEQRVQVYGREIEDAGATVATSLRNSEANLGAAIADARDNLAQSIERMVESWISLVARGLEASNQALAESEGRLSSGTAGAFGALDEKIVATLNALRPALQSAVTEVNDRSAANATDLKSAAGKHADRLLEEIRGARADSARLLARTESVEKGLVSGIQSSKAEVLERLQTASAALNGEISRQFGALNEGRIVMHAETRSSLAEQQRLLRHLRAGAVLIAVAASGTLALVAYHVLR